MVSGQPVVAKKKIFFFGKSFLYIKRNILSHRASLYLAPRVRMRRASTVCMYMYYVLFIYYYIYYITFDINGECECVLTCVLKLTNQPNS